MWSVRNNVGYQVLLNKLALREKLWSNSKNIKLELDMYECNYMRQCECFPIFAWNRWSMLQYLNHCYHCYSCNSSFPLLPVNLRSYHLHLLYLLTFSHVPAISLWFEFCTCSTREFVQKANLTSILPMTFVIIPTRFIILHISPLLCTGWTPIIAIKILYFWISIHLTFSFRHLSPDSVVF